MVDPLCIYKFSQVFGSFSRSWYRSESFSNGFVPCTYIGRAIFFDIIWNVDRKLCGFRYLLSFLFVCTRATGCRSSVLVPYNCTLYLYCSWYNYCTVHYSRVTVLVQYCNSRERASQLISLAKSRYVGTRKFVCKTTGIPWLSLSLCWPNNASHR